MLAETRRDLPPGYTGHLPFRQELIGVTTGQANKSSLVQYELNSSFQSGALGTAAQLMLNSTRDVSPHKKIEDQIYTEQKLMSMGNKSRDASTWIGGPQHSIRDQRVPGYTGFLPGIHSENVYGKSYTKCSAASLNNKIAKGFDFSPEKRYQSVNQRSYKLKNFRRMVERPELANRRDYLEYTMTLNQQDSDFRRRALDLSRSPSPQPSGPYQDEATLTPTKGDLQMSQNFYFQEGTPQIKPSLIERRIADKADFTKISEGFKRVFVQEENGSIVIPIVGYTGHRKGSRAENIFGRNFREATIQSKRLERETSQSKGLYVRA